MIINLITKISIIKIVTAENFILKAIKIDKNNIYIEINLIKQEIKISLQFAIVKSKI